MTRIPPGRKATGSVAAVFADEPFLYAYDLPDDRDVSVKIEEVLKWDQLDLAGTKHHNVYGLKFVGKKKIYLLTSKTVFKTVKRLLGDTFEGWVGKELTLYVDDNVQSFGEIVDAIRVRRPKRGRGRGPTRDDFLDDAPPPDDRDAPASAARAAAPAPVPDPATPAPAPAPAEKKDGELWAEFKRLFDRVSASFNGERVLVREAPARTGNWFTCDPVLAAEPTKVYDANTDALVVSREQLAAWTATLEGMLA